MKEKKIKEAKSPIQDGEKVVYDNLGTPYALDVEKDEVKPLREEKERLMKNDKGHWLPHVRKRAFGMYREGSSRFEIAEALGVPPTTVKKWIEGKDMSKTDPNCFFQIKKREIQELYEYNKMV